MRQISPEKTVSVVIPCYNEAEVLPLLWSRLNCAAESWPAKLEVILVDDGSTDGTWQLLTEYHQKDPRWKAVRLARNFGHQIALWTGLKHAGGDLVAILDADLQDPPEVLPSFFAEWEEDYDVIYGVRRKRKEGLLKRMAYSSFYRLISFLSDIDLPLDAGDFCVMDCKVLQVILQTREMDPYLRGIRAWVGFRQIGVPYERDARAAGEVKYTLRKLIRLAVNGIFSFSIGPLRLATYLGFTIAILSFVAGVFTLIKRVFAEQLQWIGVHYVPGFATTAISIFFLGGVQLICLGILGEYVGRIYENVKGRPQFVAREQVGFAPDHPEP